MKFLFLLGLTLGLSTGINAQKTLAVILGNFSYVQPPSNYALQGMTRYFVLVSGNGDYNENEIINNCNIQGFVKTKTKENADFIVKFSVYPTSVEDGSNTETAEKRLLTGEPYTNYTCSGKYTHKTAVVIYTANGDVVHKGESGTTAGEINFSSKKSATQPKEKYNNRRAEILKNANTWDVNDLTHKINELFATTNKTISMNVIKVKEKKYEYPIYNGAADALKSACVAVNEVELNASIKAWEKELGESDPSNRKARVNKKITAGAYYNIGLAYFTLGKYAKSEEAFNKASEFDKNVTSAHRVLISIAANMNIRLDSQIKAIEKQKAEVLMGKSCFEYNSPAVVGKIVMTSEDGTNFKGSIDERIQEDGYLNFAYVEFDAKLSNEILIVTGWMELEGYREDFSAKYKLIRGDQIQLIQGDEVYNYVNCNN